MTPAASARPPLPGGPYLVVGLARSGAAAALALRARGERVIGVDRGSPENAGRLRDAGVEVHVDASGVELVPHARTLVKSPGVPPGAPAVAAAREAGLGVLGELELAWRLVPNELVGVTGTNGKTTTTELIAHVHRVAGAPVAVAGNVGTPLSELADAGLPTGATVVCECSSFQLGDTEAFAPEAAVLLNLSPDHLDHHGGYEAYVAAKLEIFRRQGVDDVAVAPADVEIPGRARRVPFAGLTGWEVGLRGEHNRANAAAAAAVCLARGLGEEAVREGLRTFAGVPHRLEEVARRDGVLYVNDSKATNLDAALTGLRAFSGGVHLILGGRGKGTGYGALRGPVAERCSAVYAIGEEEERIAADLHGVGVPLARCGDLERAVAAARAAAVPGEVVLLSPACASYDQYPDFEARGAHFRALAAAP